MFSEYFAKHPLAEQIEMPAPMFPRAGDRAAWQAISPEDREELLAMAATYRAQPYPMRRATDFLAFVRDGSRRADETPYFFRRRKLSAAALGYCAEPNDADLDEVIDGLWCICEESSWVISAHNRNDIAGAPSPQEYPLPDVDRPYIDLFSAQTAMILSLVCSLMDEALPPMVCQRVEREIRLRVLEPFMATDDFWWMGVKRKELNNWTPWIISNVMLSAAFYAGEGLAALVERACVMLDRWLDCLPADGGCDEGAGYWNLAGGALLDCLQTLEYITAGKAGFWQNDKLRQVLLFPAKAQVAGGWFINFADCDARAWISGERLQWAGEKLGDKRLIAMGVAMRGPLAAELNDTPHLSRVLYKLFNPVAKVEDAPPMTDTWLPDLQVRMVRRGGMVLCAKGGHNNESHNHNDVGAFMLYVDGEPEIVDAGNMIYTAKTFSSQRYTLWNVRAAYHNVPLIGGQEQLPGRQYAAREVACLPDGLALDMAEAYDEQAGIIACKRTLELAEHGLTLEDDIRLRDEQSVTWVFMLRNKPEIGAGGLKSGKVNLTYDSSLTAEVEEIPVVDGRMAKSFPGSLWRVLLTTRLADRHQHTFVVKRW